MEEYCDGSVISQAEIDALLGVDFSGSSDDSQSDKEEIDQAHYSIQQRIAKAKRQILRIIELSSEESHRLLKLIQGYHIEESEELEVQRLLGEYYTFINECHAKLNHLDDLNAKNDELYKRRLNVAIKGDGKG